MQRSILRNLQVAFITLGLGMGLVFPLYARFFVDWKPGMYGWFVVGCLVAGATIGIINYALVNLLLLQKLRRISTVATAISEGDVAQRCELDSADVVGEIVASFNRMAESLRRMIARIGDVTGELTEAGGGLSRATAAARNRAGAQHQRAEHVASAMNQLGAALQEVASSTREAEEAANAAKRSSGEGLGVVRETTAAIERLAQEVEQAAVRADALERC